MRVLLALLLAVLFFFPALLHAQTDQDIVLVWVDTLNAPGVVSFYNTVWDVASSPPFDTANYQTASASERSKLITLSDVVQGETYYFAVQACDSNAACSAWTAAAVWTVPPPGGGTTPQPPISVLIIVQ